MSLTIRQSIKADEEEIFTVFSSAIESNFEEGRLTELYDGEKEVLINEQKDYFSNFLNESSRTEFFYSAIVQSRLVGTIAYGSINNLILEHFDGSLPKFEIKSAYILPKYQRSGIGSKLFQAVKTEMKILGIEAACLDCGYADSQGFWKKLIGPPVFTKKDLFGEGKDYQIWTLDL